MRTAAGLALACPLLALAACEEDESRAEIPIRDIDGSFIPVSPDDAGTPDTSCRDPGDLDCDGYGLDAGDCDDQDPARGPSALEIPQNGIDEDCMGGDAVGIDPCDAELEADELDVDEVAKALGLCRPKVTSISGRAGLIELRWKRLNGSDRLASEWQAWLPDRFGTITPREGGRMLVLSTGVARDADDRDYTPSCDVFGGGRADDGGAPMWLGASLPPDGFPQDSKQCGSQVTTEGTPAYDDVGLELTLRAPANARTLSFDSLFFTYEYPDYLCKSFNDFLIADMEGAPSMFEHDNILVDENGDPIGANSGLLSVCNQAEPARLGRPITCDPTATGLLRDTGYDRDESSCATSLAGRSNIGGAATGWLHTEVPVRPFQRIKLWIALWDSADPWLDSTVLLDNFRFSAAPPRTGTRPISRL